MVDRELISGVSSSLSWALTLAGAARGAVVIATARRRARRNQVRETAPAELLHLARLDVTHPDEISRAIESTLGEHKTLDVLVNCAGFRLRRSLLSQFPSGS